MAEENEFDDLYKRFIQTCTKPGTDKDGKPTMIVEDAIAYDGIYYILRQLNQPARLGAINTAQNHMLLKDAIEGWFILVYAKHYKTGEAVIDKDPFYISGKNFICLLYSRVEGGRDRSLMIAELQARNPAANVVMRQ